MPASALKLIQNAQNLGFLYGFAFIYATIMIVTAIVSLIIGAVFHGQCAIESNISVYLIVEGIVMTVMYSLVLSGVSQFLDTIVITFP